MVLGPHLLSLAAGYEAVAANIDEMVRDGKYSITNTLPYFPFFALPQGSTPKGIDEKRRTSDGGCPRKKTDPPAMSLNDASRLADRVPEVKPKLSHAAHDLAVLRYAANLWGLQVYMLSDDLVAFFTQLHRHGSELWKSGFFWHLMEAPAWVVEYVLGFGLVSSSGIAQRFAHALMWILCSRVEADQARMFAAETRPECLAYLEERR